MTDEQQTAAEPAPPREESVGETLARSRAALGLSLEDCAQQLKFSVKKLEALEQDRYDELHGATFARGMLRSYARLLHLDAAALIARVGDHVRVTDTTNSAVSLRRPIPFSEPGKRSNALYVGLSLAALALVAWVVLGWQQERSSATKLSFVPAAQESAAPAPQAPGAVIAAVTPSMATIRQEAAPQPPAEPTQAVPQPEAKPAAPAAEAKAPAAGKRRLVLRFERESWVEVRASNGRKLLVSEMHTPGSERVVEGEPPFSLVIGNAKHVSLTYDDKPVELLPHVKVDVARLTLQ